MFCSTTQATEAGATDAAASSEASVVIQTTKKDIAQSPLKMRFLVMLVRKLKYFSLPFIFCLFYRSLTDVMVFLKVRDCWMPDALAQMKFSPKHRSTEISQMLKVCSQCSPKLLFQRISHPRCRICF